MNLTESIKRLERYKSAQKQESGFEDDPTQQPCRNLNHEPPTYMVIPVGKIYRHACPGCGLIVRIKSNATTY